MAQYGNQTIVVAAKALHGLAQSLSIIHSIEIGVWHNGWTSL